MRLSPLPLGVAVIVLCLTALDGAAIAETAPANADSASTRLLLRTDPGLDGHQRARLASAYGVGVVRDIGVLETTVLEVPAPAAERLRSLIAQHPHVLSVEYDPRARASDDTTTPGSPPIAGLDLPPFLNGVLGVIPTAFGTLPGRTGPDPLFAQQWGLQQVRAPQAWEVTQGGPEQVVAVIDSGVDYRHLDLAGKVSLGHDWVSDDDDPSDPLLNFSHGTHVAGIIAANTSNSHGIAGMAPLSRILAIRVLGVSNSGYHSDIASGIVEATDRGARVINLSLGGPDPSTVLEHAIDYAVERGVFVACATGNDSSTRISYPAAYDGCFAVGASDQDDDRASFSNTGAGIDLVAPGTSILSLAPPQLFVGANGTSMATPFVAATASLLRARGLDTAGVRDRLVSTSTDLGTRGYDTQFGWGRLDAAAAVGAQQPVAPPPGAPWVRMPGQQPTSAPTSPPPPRAAVRLTLHAATARGVRKQCGATRSRSCRVRARNLVRFVGTATSTAATTGRRITITACRAVRHRWSCSPRRSTVVRAGGKLGFSLRPSRGVWRIVLSAPVTPKHAAATSAPRYVTATR